MHSCGEKQTNKLCSWTQRKSESLLSVPHCALFAVHSRYSHSLHCYTVLKIFGIQHVSASYISTSISLLTICIPCSPVRPQAFLSVEATWAEHARYSTVTHTVDLNIQTHCDVTPCGLANSHLRKKVNCYIYHTLVYEATFQEMLNLLLKSRKNQL
jgi:hypothetical protein